MDKRLKSVNDVVNWHLCLGCGACSYICPHDNIQIQNVLALGHRPKIKSASPCKTCAVECLKVCPAVQTTAPAYTSTSELQSFLPAAGPFLKVWEGFAIDPEIRFAGSSGGALTALALFCIEKDGMHGTLHIAQRKDAPLQNTTRLSRSRAELLENTGSRYAPASVCDGLSLVEHAPAPCVVIGQPSEVAAVRKALSLRPALDQKIGVLLSFFCAGSPATAGVAALLKKNAVDPSQVQSLRYRGRGWPGHFAVWLKDRPDPALEMTYKDSWAFLQAFRPWSTHIWPDGTGEHADISCGDPWYRPINPGEPGTSLVVARTPKGAEIVEAAIKHNYLSLVEVDPSKLIASQKNLFEKKGAVGGRLATMRLMGRPTPEHRGYHLLQNWRRLSVKQMLQSTAGTARRIWSRRLFRPASPSFENES